jgi:hypothetical protein
MCRFLPSQCGQNRIQGWTSPGQDRDSGLVVLFFKIHGKIVHFHGRYRLSAIPDGIHI